MAKKKRLRKKAAAKRPRRAAPKASIGLREYARHRAERGLVGTSHTAVRRAIDSGRLVESVTTDARGRPRITDPSAADEEWAKNTDPTQARPDSPASKESEVPPIRPPEGQELLFPDAESARKELEKPENGDGGTNYRKAAAIRQAWLARAAELDVLERAGKLVRVEQVEAEAFRRAREVRDAILRVPHRIAAELAATETVHEARTCLERELNAALVSLADAS